MGRLTLPADGVVLHIGPPGSGTATIREAFGSGVEVVGREDLAAADSERAAGALKELGADGAYVVATAGRFDWVLPYGWQALLRDRGLVDYGRWLSIVFGDDPAHRAHRHFWSAHDVLACREVWMPLVGEDRFAVVADDTGPQLLGAGAAELLRAVNRAARHWDREEYDLLVRTGLVGRLAEIDSMDGHEMPALPAWAVERAREATVRREEALTAAGVRVLGDLASVHMPDTAAPTELADMPGHAGIEYAASAIDGMRASAMTRLVDARRDRKAGIDALRERSRQAEHELVQRWGGR